MTLPESPEELLGQPTDMSMGQSTAPPTTASGGMAYASDGYLAPSSGGGYSSGGVTYSPLLGAHLRARYNTRSYGQTRGNLDLGAMKLYDQGDSAWFLDGQVVINDENQFGYNAGIGYRFLTLPLLPFTADDQKLAGISVWSDGMFTVNDNFISQIGISAEYLGEYWDLRSNVYIPFADIEVGDFESNGEITYFGNFLAEQTVAPTDEALTVTDIEVARRLGEIEAWGFLGGYGMYGDETDTAGYKVGLRGYATPDILLQFAVVDDDVFGTNAVFSGTWFIGRTRANTPQRTPIAMRMREPVIRNNYIAVRQGTRTSGDALVGDVDGNGTDEEIRVVHFDPNAPDGGDGSFERPFNNLSDAQQTGFETSIALVRSGTFTDDVLNADFARILGEGNDIEHTIVTTTRGTVTLPETSAGARSLSAPNINLTGFTDDAITLAKLTSEVSNFEITGGNRAIVSPAGVAAVDINNVSVDGTFGNAIELTAASVQSDPNDTSVLQSQFSPTLSDLTFTNVGGDDINLDATLAVTGGPTQVENIGITNVTSTDGTGVGIRITENVNAVTINDFTHSGGLGVTGGALQVNDGTGALAVTDATISNQVGFGIQLNNSDAGHTFNDVTITDTGAAAFEVVGGPTNAATTTTFTGQINQGGTGAAVSISGEHGGTITFAESTTDAGVVNATNGTGIQLNDADGSYAFNSAVVLNGGDAGIDMLNDTDGDLTITDGTIVSPTGAAVNVEDGNATLFYTGSITQANNAAAVNVSGGVNGHEGTLIFDEGTTDAGVITATNGSGLRFENANGGYIFNDAVVLNGTTNGANTGIGLTSGSDGNFQFADATIVDPTGDAISIDGGDSTQVFNYTGTITQSNNAAALSVTGGHEGQVTISPETAGDPSITATNGTGLVFNQANGAYTIDGEVTLNGTTNNAATGISITNSGVDAADPADDLLATFNFNDVTITDPNGVGLAISGGNNNVNYTGSVTQNTNAFAAVSVAGGHVGTLTMNGATSTSNVVTASQGAGITFNNADGTYAINGVVELDSSVTGGATGISIVNSGESGEAASFTFTDATITDPNAVGLAINGGVADVNFTGQINQGANNFAAVEVTGGHEGTVNLSEGTADAGVVVATAGAGVNLNDADGNYFFNDGVNLTGGPRIQVNNGSSGLASFDADSTITNATGDALVVENSDATVIYDGEITDNAGNAVLIQGNTGGSVAVSGMVTSTGSGVVIQANTDGNYSLTGGLELTTGANNAVTVTGNDATVTITGAEITTTTGDGFSVTANTGGTTTINTATVDTGDGDAI
ncbi:MAG: inverse autotransporter beta domain-containing protein [Planctomycetota bacterium]